MTNPPHGPIAARAKEYAPPVWGSAADISPMEKSIVKYMTTTITTAIAMPPKPAWDMPRFQPENSPEMTAATPRPQIPHTPALRLSVRFSKYPGSTLLYVTPAGLVSDMPSSRKMETSVPELGVYWYLVSTFGCK